MTGVIHEMFKKNAEKHRARIVDETMMKNYFERLEDSGIVYHETKSYPSRGRVNHYYSKYSPKELYDALTKNGFEPWTETTANEYFR